MSIEEVQAVLETRFPHVATDDHFQGKGVTVWRCTDYPLDSDTKYSKLANFALVDGFHITKRAMERMLEQGKSLYENHTSAGDVSAVDAGFFNGYGRFGRSVI